MSGIEVVGLVMGGIPLIFEIWKYQEANIESIRNAMSRPKQAKSLGKFYKNLHFELFKLTEITKTVIGQLDLSEDIQRSLNFSMTDAQSLDVWSTDPTVHSALELFFGKDQLDPVLEIIRRIMKLFAKIIGDESVYLTAEHKNQLRMFKKLDEFKKGIDNEGKDNGFRKRLQFFRGSDARTKKLEALKKATDDLDWIVKSVTSRTQNRSMTRSGSSALITTDSPMGPTSIVDHDSTSPTGYPHQLKTATKLSKRLFMALFKFWRCNCPNQWHDAKLCLKDCAVIDHCYSNSTSSTADSDKSNLGTSSVAIDFLVRVSQAAQCQSGLANQWYDGTASLRLLNISSGYSNQAPTVASSMITGICQAIQQVQCSEHVGLDLLIEDDEKGHQPRFWPQQRSRKFHHQQALSDISFDSYLRSCKKPPSRKDRRNLALILAYSLLRLHGSPWINNQWDKRTIHFYKDIESKNVDVQSPYLATAFESGSVAGSQPSVQAGAAIKHPGIVKLGILLIEVNEWKPIEDFREPEDYLNGKITEYTDVNVAYRVADSLQDDFCDVHKRLIKSCLNQPWLKPNSTGVSQDEMLWSGVYNNIIVPLEKERRYVKEIEKGMLQA